MSKTVIVRKIVDKGSAVWQNLALSTMEIFYPTKCAICGKYGLILCQACYSKISTNSTNVCPLCGKISVNCHYCSSCRKKKGLHIDAIIVAAKYNEGGIKELIYKLKYHGFTAVSDIFADLMAMRMINVKTGKDWIISFVPLHRFRQNFRGFNQSELIAQRLGERIKLSCEETLQRVKNTISQTLLNKKERQQNVSGVFRSKGDLTGKSIILVDDVTSTGSTLNSAASTLKSAGAKKVYGIVVARNI